MPSTIPTVTNSAVAGSVMQIDTDIVLLLAGRHADSLGISPYNDDGEYDPAFSSAAIGAAGGIAEIDACDSTVVVYEAMKCAAEMTLAVVRNPLGDLTNEASRIYSNFGSAIKEYVESHRSSHGVSMNRAVTTVGLDEGATQ